MPHRWSAFRHGPAAPSSECRLRPARKAKAICKLSAVYEPGTRCAYTSGTGFDLLGQIVVVTDPKRRSFNRIAKEELFDPLGMRTTSFGLATDHPKRVPVSHTRRKVAPPRR